MDQDSRGMNRIAAPIVRGRSRSEDGARVPGLQRINSCAKTLHHQHVT